MLDFLKIIKISIKNITRNSRRSLITILSIFVGSIALIFFGGYVETMKFGLKDQAISHEFGHFQIAQKDYFNENSTSYDHLMRFADVQKLIDTIENMYDIEYLNYRLHFSGMVTGLDCSAIFYGIAGVPEVELSMMPQVQEGTGLSPTNPYGIVIGSGLARKLKAKIGDPLILFFASETGTQEAIQVSVCGIFKALMKEVDNMMIYIPIETAWELMLEKKIHRIICFSHNESSIAEVTDILKKIIASGFPNLALKLWDELAVFYNQIVRMFNGIVFVVGFIIYFIIMFNISNMMYMVIHERTKEIGTLRAIGNTKFQIIGLLYLEALILCTIGVGSALLLCTIGIPIINQLKLTLPPGPGQEEPMPVYVSLNYFLSFLVVLINFITVSIGTFIPSLKIMRMKVVDALREANK